MLELKEIALEDKGWIDEILRRCKYKPCEYSFGNNFIWSKAYEIKVGISNGFFIASLHKHGKTSFLYPVGDGDISPVIDEMIEYANKNHFPFHMHCVSDEGKSQLERLFPGKFEIIEDRDSADYIYSSEDLINLAGKKYHAKRNHIKKFKCNSWSFEPITENNIDDCIKMNIEWCKKNNCELDEGMSDEWCAIKRSFKYFKQLDFFGGLLRIDGRVVAYTIAEELTEDTVVVHIEKAFSDIQGAYPAINQEFAANMASNYRYINREEDLGIEGLRKAKLSYYPEILLTKYIVKLT